MVIQFALKAIPTIGKAGWKRLVPLGVGAAAALGAGIKGSFDSVRGRKLRKEVQERLEDSVAQCEATRATTEQVAREYGEHQIRAHKDTVGRLANWLEQNKHLVKRLNFKKIDGVRIRVPSIPKYVTGFENVATGFSGLAGAVGAGVSAQAGALWGVSTFASASTGTTISSLGGIAAQNATLAWLGGGTLATGGGGVAAGGAVLGLVAIVPALIIGGTTMGIMGARTKTKARRFVAKAELEIERIGLAGDMLRAAERRIDEFRDLLGRMSERATRALDNLEAFEFDPELYAREFLHALQLVTAVKEVLNTPILDPKSGELTEASIEILRKYA